MGDFSCYGATVNADPHDAHSTISCIGNSSCFAATINGGIGNHSSLTTECVGPDCCKNTVIDASTTNEFTLSGCTEPGSCAGVDLQCPIDHDPSTCTVSAMVSPAAVTETWCDRNTPLSISMTFVYQIGGDGISQSATASVVANIVSSFFASQMPGHDPSDCELKMDSLVYPGFSRAGICYECQRRGGMSHWVYDESAMAIAFSNSFPLDTDTLILLDGSTEISVAVNLSATPSSSELAEGDPYTVHLWVLIAVGLSTMCLAVTVLCYFHFRFALKDAVAAKAEEETVAAAQRAAGHGDTREGNEGWES